MMKTKWPLFLGLILFISSAFTISSFQTWNIAADYNIRFEGRNAKGTFTGLNGTIQFDPSNLSTAMMDVSVNTNTILTGNKTKNKHARGKNWFEVEKYPTIRFQSSKFRKANNSYEVIGQLTLHGVTKEVTIPFQFSEQAAGALFTGNFAVNRKDYGIIGPIGNFTVGNEFKIQLKVPVK